jgi:hypothetical protein
VSEIDFSIDPEIEVYCQALIVEAIANRQFAYKGSIAILDVQQCRYRNNATMQKGVAKYCYQL